MQVLAQVKLDISFVLVMNMMRNRMESAQEVARFDTKEQAIAFMNGEKVEHYVDPGPDGWGQGTINFNKCFRKGGPLEWYNPLSDAEIETPNRYGHGIHKVTTLLEEPVIIQQLE